MIEVAYEGSTLLIFLVFLLGLGVLGSIVAIIGMYLGRPDSRTTQQILQSPPPMWWESTTISKKKPVRTAHSLPYGAYGTDIRFRGRRARR